MSSESSHLSWSQTIRLLFQTPLVPSENKEEKAVEIGMTDLSPPQSAVSSQRNSLDFGSALPVERRASPSQAPWSSDISL